MPIEVPVPLVVVVEEEEDVELVLLVVVGVDELVVVVGVEEVLVGVLFVVVVGVLEELELEDDEEARWHLVAASWLIVAAPCARSWSRLMLTVLGRLVTWLCSWLAARDAAWHCPDCTAEEIAARLACSRLA